MKFETIFIVGEGRVAKKCQEIATNFFQKEAVYLNFKQSQDADDFFKKTKNCLIISANNFYIFKKEAIQNNTIINYHNSLLPNHRGTNAHIWAIYEDDKQSGITWHIVDSTIDTGDIIIQKTIELTPLITAKELLIAQHKMAIQSLGECLNLLTNNQTRSQNPSQTSTTHRKKDLPNGGICDLSWSKEKISSFLRAMDAGAFRQIALPKIYIFNEWFEIGFYEITDTEISLNLNGSKNIEIKFKDLK